MLWMVAGLWAAEPSPAYMGRTIATTLHEDGQPWLIRPERESEERGAELRRALRVKKGQVVCDVGAGNGFHSLPLAEKIGPTGRVIATDIQQGMLDGLRARAESAGIENIEPVLSTVSDASLPPDTCDLVLLVDVYHEFSDPASMLEGIRASLTAEGRVALVEYRGEDERVPMKPLHKMSVVQCDREYEANGFRRIDRYNELPWQHVLFYAREEARKTP